MLQLCCILLSLCVVTADSNWLGYPPSSVSSFTHELTYCRKEGVPDTSTTTLSELTNNGQRIVVIANYFTGCTGGRQEAAAYADLEIAAKTTYGDDVLFVTNLVQSSTNTNCNGWIDIANAADRLGKDFKPSIFSSNDQASVNIKALSYTYFNNLHPQYMVIDANLNTHLYESSDLPGPCKNKRVVLKSQYIRPYWKTRTRYH